MHCRYVTFILNYFYLLPEQTGELPKFLSSNPCKWRDAQQCTNLSCIRYPLGKTRREREDCATLLRGCERWWWHVRHSHLSSVRTPNSPSYFNPSKETEWSLRPLMKSYPFTENFGYSDNGYTGSRLHWIDLLILKIIWYCDSWL